MRNRAEIETDGIIFILSFENGELRGGRMGDRRHRQRIRELSASSYETDCRPGITPPDGTRKLAFLPVSIFKLIKFV